MIVQSLSLLSSILYTVPCHAMLSHHSFQSRVSSYRTPSMHSPIIYTHISSHHPTQQHSPNLPLYTFPRLQHPLISTNKQTLPGLRQPLHKPGLPPPNNPPQALNIHPHPLRRLTNHTHTTQHRLIIPILHAQPRPPRADILLRDGLGHVRREVIERGRCQSAPGHGGEEAGLLEREGEG